MGEAEEIGYKQSEFNSGISVLMRVNTLWISSHSAVGQGNYLRWNNILDRIWLEIIGDLPLNAPERMKMNEYNKELVKLFPLTTGTVVGFNKITPEMQRRISQQYILLRKKEEFIKFNENKLGLGKAYVDEMEDDWD